MIRRPPRSTLFSLHDALPIFVDELAPRQRAGAVADGQLDGHQPPWHAGAIDRKSTRLNSSHPSISYAVFCLKKKKIILMLNFLRLILGSVLIPMHTLLY